MTSLLPLNSTPLERAIEVATDETTDIPLRTLYNPQSCPAHLLYHLAWAWSVDRWDDEWPEAVKRAAISASFFIHERKGTIGAIRRAVEPLGYLIDVLEWWQRKPMGEPGTFGLKVGVLDTGITEVMYQELTALIDDAKPVSRHLLELAISLETSGRTYFAVGLTDGDEIDVYPPAPRDIEVYGVVGLGGRETIIDSLDVFA
ncbi:phage tail protein I [Pseudomonas syringae]|uniref:phage tail protein I n=1 Tax=Pseudomonas syringae TaxID=317 RepID=UPI001BD07849|nr:phage tail protein I [Pseudomonas syringae]MBS7440630.1 phage tail protein I [Pseudomonas syringae]